MKLRELDVKKLEILSKMSAGVATDKEKRSYWDLCQAPEFREVFGEETECSSFSTITAHIDAEPVELCPKHHDKLWEGTMDSL